MDNTVLYNLTYGLYIVGAMDNNRPVGCVINTCFQVTSANPILAISLNKNNYTLEAIKKSKRFSLSIVDENTDNMIIATFGFCSSRDNDKYTDFGYNVLSDAPIVNGKFTGRIVLDAINFVDNETHVVVLARVVDTLKEKGTPMTYAYYHNVIKGKAPENAPTHIVENVEPDTAGKAVKNRYVCNVCGYVAECDDQLPDDFTCPICKVDKLHFHLAK